MKMVFQKIVFFQSETVELCEVNTNSKQGLPVSNWVRAYNRVDGNKLVSCVLGRTTFPRIDVEFSLRGLFEGGLGICAGQGFQIRPE